MAAHVGRAEPIAHQVDAMLTDLEDRVNRSLERLEFTDEVIQLCILRITKELIMKSVRNRELQQQQRQFNPHLSTYQRARPFTDGLLYGTGAVTHVLNPSGTTSFTSAQKRIPDDAEEHADERALGSPATSGIGSGGSKETGAGTGGTGTGTPAGSDTGDADCTSGGSPPGPAGSEEPQPIGGDPPPRDMDDE
ncbi:hypothetical protein KFE25_008129 [Diacronema lutheri]|uniref:Uncharacterized protein n=1 Tax=Diacronema lutheri TaxID=2081491 RepID=A0A8J5XWH5_DIALT|nr:hypothetical protein KFE25_008129 [Diacronema lutheri]